MCQGIEIEGFNDIGVDVQYPWEDTPRRFHEHPMQIKSFWIDKYPVTNAQFKKFLDATHYRPQDDLNFLHDWKNGNYPAGCGQQASDVGVAGGCASLCGVGREAAAARMGMAICGAGHRWAYFIPGEMNGRPTPFPCRTRVARCAGRTPSMHIPKGASPFGVMDLVGNVWQWTEEFQDEHTRGGILRGGSYYQPQGSIWYFPQAYKLSEHGKLLMTAPSMDRSGGLGFRCVQDAE